MHALLFSLALGAPAEPPVDAAYFETTIRPLFAKHCASCHDAKKAKGGLELTGRAAALAGGESGPALVPGDAAKSRLVQAVHYDGALKMPPKGKLAAEEIQALSLWVRGGAPWPEAGEARSTAKPFDVKAIAAGHWAYAPMKPSPGANIDALWKQTGKEPERRSLIRRLTFDVTGLPPTPAEMTAFLNDTSPDAYAKLVDRLLASPAYGERWARHWLDLVRYAETQGHEFDFEIPDAWRYRDYVVRAFNDDLPYNQFVREQIAGDLLPPRWHPAENWNESLIATGFWCLGEGKHSPVDVRQEQADRIDNMIDVFGKTFLGQTIACARCHDHKFDPIRTRDYYALYGILSSSRYQRAFIDRVANGGVAEPVPAPPRAGSVPAYESFGPGWRERWFVTGPAFARPGEGPPFSGRDGVGFAGSLRSPTITLAKPFLGVRVAGKQTKVRLVVDGLQLIQDPIYGGLSRGIDHDDYRWLNFDVRMWAGHAAYLEFLDEGPGTFAVSEVAFSDAALAEAAAPGPTPGTLTAREARRAPAMAEGTGRDERVFVRGSPKTLGEVAPRRFMELFPAELPAHGSGRRELADAVADPAHPLTARVFVNRVWQHYFGDGLVPSVDDFGHQGTKPTRAELLDALAAEFVQSGWKVKALQRRILMSGAYRTQAKVRRLEAEAIRDAMLAVSGRLDAAAGGPGVPPYLTEHMSGRGRPGASGPLDGLGRRSLYLQVRRNFLNPMFLAFDYPTPFTTMGRRGTSNVPAQALVMLNNPFVRQQAELWAKRGSGPRDARIRRMYAEAFAREPSEAELFIARASVPHDNPAEWAALAHALFNAKEFVFLN